MTRTTPRVWPDAATTRVAELEAQVSELQAVRRTERLRIIEIAQRYALRHNLCSVVDEALTEAGLLGAAVRKQIEVLVPMTVVLDMNADLVETSTEDELKALLSAAKISTVTWDQNTGAVVLGVANGRARLAQPSTVIGDIQVISVGDVTGPVPGAIPAGYGRYYSSVSTGRVQHYVETDRVNRGRNAYSLCADVGGYGWSLTSVRGEDRVCRNCARRAAVNT